jgi:hypothetical protein
MVERGVLRQLMMSPNPGTRAAAASTMTKLSIKAKALTEDSSEVSSILNAVLDVLKIAISALNNPDAPADDLLRDGSVTGAGTVGGGVLGVSKSTESPVSFSVHQDGNGGKTKGKAAEQSIHQLLTKAKLDSNSVTMTSIERAIEVLATLTGKTYIKEEIVHGSFRVSACIPELLKLVDLDVRSTAAYGLAHILSCLTVTNYELRAKALAEKEMTPEMYDQLQEMQRIKAKEEDGENAVEETKEEEDPDSTDLCRRRIKRIIAPVQKNSNNSVGKDGNDKKQVTVGVGSSAAIAILLKFISSEDATHKTKECAARALRQICVEESARGFVVQQGDFSSL